MILRFFCKFAVLIVMFGIRSTIPLLITKIYLIYFLIYRLYCWYFLVNEAQLTQLYDFFIWTILKNI